MRQPVTPVKDTRLHLELLKVDEGAFPGYKRNIFGSVEPPPPPPPKVVPPPAGRRGGTAAARLLPPVQEELAQFNFLGYLEKDGRKTVFLSRDHTLYLVNQGTRFGDQQEFMATELTPERLVIQSAKDDRQIVVPLVENQPLIPLFHPGSGGSREAAPRLGSPAGGLSSRHRLWCRPRSKSNRPRNMKIPLSRRPRNMKILRPHRRQPLNRFPPRAD